MGTVLNFSGRRTTPLVLQTEATECGLAFYPTEKIVFASDCPFDPEKGTMYTRETLKILDGIDMSKAKRKAIMHGNLERITGRKLT